MTEKPKKKRLNIGLNVNPPQNECDDVRCPWHGKLSVRGNVFEGEVVSDKAHRTVIVKLKYYHYIPKYERYERRNTKLTAHNPPCISAKTGDRVTVAECRPLSKTKKFVVIEKKF